MKARSDVLRKKIESASNKAVQNDPDTYLFISQANTPPSILNPLDYPSFIVISPIRRWLYGQSTISGQDTYSKDGWQFLGNVFQTTTASHQ